MPRWSRMETPAVVQQVSHLFQGHETLLRGFQNFLSGSSALIEPAGDSVSGWRG